LRLGAWKPGSRKFSAGKVTEGQGLCLVALGRTLGLRSGCGSPGGLERFPAWPGGFLGNFGVVQPMLPAPRIAPGQRLRTRTIWKGRFCASDGGGPLAGRRFPRRSPDWGLSFIGLDWGPPVPERKAGGRSCLEPRLANLLVSGAGSSGFVKEGGRLPVNPTSSDFDRPIGLPEAAPEAVPHGS